MNLWTRFGPRLRQALAAALESAGLRGCDELAVEHLALAICRDNHNAANFIFEAAGLSRSEILRQLEEIEPSGANHRQRAPRLSSETLQLLIQAAAEADERKNPLVGTDHVLLALIQSDIAAARFFKEYGLTRQQVDDGARRWFTEQMMQDRKLARRPWVGRLPRGIRRTIGFPYFAWKIFVEKSLAHPRFRTNPYPLYRWLQENHPVRQDPLAPVWVVSRHADVMALLKDPRFRKDPFAVERLPSGIREQLGVSDNQVRAADLEVISMLFLDPPEHTRVRALFSRAFTPRMIAGLRGRIQQITDERLAPVLAKGEMDVIETLAYPLPVVVIAEMLGFPAEDYPLYKKWSDDFTAALGINPSPEDQAQATASREELRAYFDKMVKRMRSEEESGRPRPETGWGRPGSTENLITALLEMEDEPGALSRDELFINSALLLAAGHETTTNLIANGMLALLKNPEQLELLRREQGLIESAVEELLRFDSPVQWVSRISAEKLEIGGVSIEPGTVMLGSIGAANHDPRQFANPERLDIRRSDNKHLSFGSGVHFCLGAALARMEAQIAIGTMVRRLPNLRLAERKIHWKKGLIFRAATQLRVRFEPPTTR